MAPSAPIWAAHDASPTAMPTTNPFDAADGDHLHEECGIFGVSASPGAAALVALGLHALQHRGQEAAGITSFDGTNFHTHRAMGHVAGNFDRDEIIRALPGEMAAGHVRYSTTGETALRNVQPLYAELSVGRLRDRAQRQHLECDAAAQAARPARIDLPVDQRYRDDHPSRRDEPVSHLARQVHRCAEAGRGRLFAGRDDARGYDRVPRSARHPPARDGAARPERWWRGDLRIGNGGARRGRRDVRARGRSR